MGPERGHEVERLRAEEGHGRGTGALGGPTADGLSPYGPRPGDPPPAGAAERARALPAGGVRSPMAWSAITIAAVVALTVGLGLAGVWAMDWLWSASLCVGAAVCGVRSWRAKEPLRGWGLVVGLTALAALIAGVVLAVAMAYYVFSWFMGHI